MPSTDRPRARASKPLPERAPTGAVIGAALALIDVASTPLAESVDRFWTAPVPLPAAPPTIETDADLLLRQLPTPAAAIGGPELVDALRPAYQQLGSALVDRAPAG